MTANSTEKSIPEMVSQIRKFYSTLQSYTNIQSWILIDQLARLYKYSLYLFIIIGAFGLVFNIIFSSRVIRGMRCSRLSHKRYFFILSRAFSDSISSGLVLLWASADLLHLLNPKLIDRLHLIQITLGYCSVTGSMLALAIVTFLATKYPFYYHANLTLLQCVWYVSLIWLWSITITVALASIGSNQLFTHKSENCSYACQLALFCLSIALLLASYLSVPLMYLAVLISLYRRMTDSNRQHNIWQLGISIVSYTILNCPFVMLTISGAILLRHEGQPLRSNKQITTSVFVLRLVAALLLSLRALLDPILSVAIDRNLRRAVAEQAALIPNSFRNTVLIGDNSEHTQLLRNSNQGVKFKRSASVNLCARESQNKDTNNSLRIGFEEISKKLSTTDTSEAESQC